MNKLGIVKKNSSYINADLRKIQVENGSQTGYVMSGTDLAVMKQAATRYKALTS